MILQSDLSKEKMYFRNIGNQSLKEDLNRTPGKN